MKIISMILLGFIFFVTLTGSAYPITFKITCPIGGGQFKESTSSDAIDEETGADGSGKLLDGMPVFWDFGGGGLLPICPNNGLVMYRSFSKTERPLLRSFIKSDTYRRAKENETVRYRIYLIERALKPDSEDLPWLLLKATWEAKNESFFSFSGEINSRSRLLATRYQREFRATVANLLIDNKSLPSIALRARAVNAARELGEFELAEQELAAIKIDPEAGGASADAKQERKEWADYLDVIKPLIARRDSARTPIDLLKTSAAADWCAGGRWSNTVSGRHASEKLTPFELEYCKRPEIVKALEGSQRQ
jgi:hypothetical protein